MERLFSQNEKENIKVAKKILDNIKSSSSNVLLLYGNLGAGKTAITREISGILNTKNRVSSPTFIVQKIYSLGKNSYNFDKINHIDLYRISTNQEVQEMGLFENMDKKTLYIIEWPESVQEYFNNALKVKISTYKNGRVFKMY